MFIPSGFRKDDMGDIDVIVHKDVLHVFYLCTTSQDRVGHLTSTDGLNWQEQRPAIFTGNPGEFDDDQIWTMCVFAFNGKFFMLYTGLAMKERGKVQRVGLATSDDLFTWTKYDRNPVICADPRWYEAQTDAMHRVDWRDPWVYVDGDMLHGIICARTNHGPMNRRGCVGYFTSTNGYDWVLQPPLCSPEVSYDFEVPAIAKIKGRYYLTGIAGKNMTVMTPNVYRVADKITGPYRRVEHDEILSGENFVFKPCVWKGKTLYFHTLHSVSDWNAGSQQPITSFTPPKLADADENGALILRPFDGWDAVASAPMVKHDASSLLAHGTAILGKWSEANALLRCEKPDGFAALLLQESQQSIRISTEFKLQDAKELGIILRGDTAADDATFVILTPALRRIQLVTIKPYYKSPSVGVTYRWRGRRIVQEWYTKESWGKQLRVDVVAFGPYVEVSLENRVVISAITMNRVEGQIGLFCEDGTVEVQSLAMQPLHAPACQATCT